MGRNAGTITFGLVLALAAASASAQMYSWKDAKGVTHFSDQPPPGEVKALASPLPTPARTGVAQPALPYALNDAVKRNPVVLYTTASCGACDQGRALLMQRGVPFTEKTVSSNEDQQVLQAAGGEGRLPLLVVGSNRKGGFESGAWQEALTAANYPQQSRLPAGWRQSPAMAAAPAAAPATPAVPTAELARDVVAGKPEQPPKKLPPKNAPPGFQF